MPSPDAINALHAQQVQQVRAQLLKIAEQLYVKSPRNFVDALLPQVLAGQLVTAQLTDQYLHLIGDALGTSLPPSAGITPDDVEGLRGIDPRVEYSRPLTSEKVALAAGASPLLARQRGLNRLRSLVSTDLQLAYTHQTKKTLKTWKGDYFKRVTSGDRTCALCMIASTQRYYKSKLMPIHPGCGCTVAPLPPSQAARQVIDKQRLEEVHESVRKFLGAEEADRSATDYNKLILVREHGEYGPTLTWESDSFTGPNDIKH